MKCSNCPSNAAYVVNDPGVSLAYYCVKCLPQSLHARANAGQLDLPKVEEPKAETTKAKTTKKKTAEAPSEPVEEATDENPTA